MSVNNRIISYMDSADQVIFEARIAGRFPVSYTHLDVYKRQATPWADKPKAFYYNQKINCLPASGCIRLGEEQWRFRPEDAMGVLDWGRGVWTYDNIWYLSLIHIL